MTTATKAPVRAKATDAPEETTAPEEAKKVIKEDPQPIVLVPPMDPNAVAPLVVPLNPNLPVVSHLDISKCPKFSTQEVAQVFFQRSSAWIRWVDRRGLLDRDATGRRVVVERLNDPTNGMKRYSLADIEETARILHQNAIISPSRLALALQIIQLIAIGYGVVPVD